MDTLKNWAIGLAAAAAFVAIIGGIPWAMEGGTTASPARHESRMVTASGVPAFTIRCNPQMWERTKGLDNESTASKAKPKTVVEAVKVAEEQGMAVVTLSGPEMVDYLRVLDWHAHGSRLLPVRDKNPVAVRMYDALAERLDTIETGGTGQLPNAVEITVNDGDPKTP